MLIILPAPGGNVVDRWGVEGGMNSRAWMVVAGGKKYVVKADRMTEVFDEHLDLESWIRPAVEGGLDGVRKLEGLTWAGLHGDPAAEAFLRQADGVTALIDWGGAMLGPVLYDLGTLVMYLSKPDHVVAAYLAERPALTKEVTTHLDTFINFRWAIQAAYFAWRLATDVQTGLTTSDGNHQGLTDARRWFEV
jgi:homoserine kinase type II